MTIQFWLNQQSVTVDVLPARRAVDVLREDLGVTGTKEGCGSGECGACSILVDGESRLSCLMIAAQLEGKHIATVEHLAEQHPKLIDAFVHHGAVQCGYCSPGMVVSSVDLLARNATPNRDEIRHAISGNLCRCTGYQKIIDAVEQTAAGQEKRP